MISTVYFALLATIASQPGASCPVLLIPSDAPRAWISAASALARSLRETATADYDCREIVVRAAAPGATEPASVEVITADGRRGVRTLADARDLEPTVAALIVTVSFDPEVVRRTARDNADDAPASSRARWHLLLLAGTGARLTLPSAAAPVLDLMVGVVGRPLELALYGSWAPILVGTGAATRAGFSSTAELGLSFAYRRSVRSTDLIGGVRAAAVGLWGYTLDDNGAMTGSATGSFGEGTTTTFVIGPALSIFAGPSIPFVGTIRLRPHLSFQWLPLGMSTADSASSIWSLGLGLGFESGTP